MDLALYESREALRFFEQLERYMTDDDLELLKRVLEQNKGRELEVLEELTAFTYRHTPVGVRKFMEDSDYLGLKGQVFPKVLDDLEELFSGQYIEAILTGSIGWGKSTFAELAMARMLYEVSCFKDPQKVYGLMRGSVIAFVNVSVNKENSKKVVFQGIKSKIANSPYFQTKFPPEKELAEELRFPNKVWVFPVASGETSILGYNVFGGVMDEVNFMSVIEGSKRARDTNVYDHAVTLQRALIRRMKSRFMQKGKLPGILIQVSSSKYPDDYTERRALEAQDDTTIFFRRYAQWDTLPPDRFSGETFTISLGLSSEQPKILENEEDANKEEEKGAEVIDIPVEYRTDFERDINAAIRDYAGRPTLTIQPFLTYRWKVRHAMDRGEESLGLKHPFSKEVTTLTDGGMFLPDRLLIPKYRKLAEKDPDTYEELYKNLKKRPRFIHVDLAATNMAGIAMGFVYDYLDVSRKNEEGKDYTLKAPIIVIEMMLRVQAPKDGEIEIADVRNLIYELRSYGYWIKKVSFDQYQSLESRQQLKRSGIEAEHLSVEAIGPYNDLKAALYEDRLLTYYYDPSYWELIRLELNNRTGKVDHPPKGSKDVADAMAGVVRLCVEGKPQVGTPPPIMGEVYGSNDGEEMEKKKTVIPIVRG